MQLGVKHFGGFLAIGLVCLLAIAVHATEDGANSAFDETRAFSHLRAIVEIGPRPPDSPGSARAREYVMNELARQGLEVRQQSFVAQTPLGDRQMQNIIGIVPGRTDEVIIIGAHYDTKLIASFPFVGANDGASGPAILLELAHILQKRDKPLAVWLTFFDGEEALVNWSDRDSLYGSRHMVSRLTDSGEIRKVKAVVLLDMVGDSHLSIETESFSTSWLRKIVWDKAKELGYKAHFTDNREGILDDHIPFLKHGIPALDIIDFHYGPRSRTNEYWHSPYDTLDNVSPRSLKIVGDVVIESLPEIMKRLEQDERGRRPERKGKDERK